MINSILRTLIPFLMGMLVILPAFSVEETPDSVSAVELRELVVTGGGARARLSKMLLGEENIELSRMALLPAFFGENDIVRSLGLLPGVRAEEEGSGGFEVRGGASSGNLILLDGITLYNPSHVMGVFSTFNDASLGKATLFKGPVPAAFGGASSAVLETTLQPGDMRRPHVTASLGLLLAKVHASVPVVPGKLSLAVGARRSYADLFISMVPKFKGTIMNFYDVTAKLRYTPSPSDAVEASFIIGRDNMALKNVMGLYWGNIGTSVSWVKRKTDDLMFTTVISYTDYSPEIDMGLGRSDQVTRQYVRDASVNHDISWNAADGRSLRFGLRSGYLRVKSAEMKSADGRLLEVRFGMLNAIWGEYEENYSCGIGVSAGVRLNLFSVPSAGRFHAYHALNDWKAPDFSAKSYFIPEPRLNVRYDISGTHNLKVGISLASQCIHALRTSSTSFPFDRYTLSSARVRPTRVWQYVAGYSGMTPSGDFDWSAEAYFKDMDNVYDYRDGCSMFSQINMENIILGGRGRSVGAEFMLRKNNGLLSGWISYTISSTQTKIAGINDGRWYAASNDRRHNVNIVSMLKPSPAWTISGIWTFSSGSPLTVPAAKYSIDGNTCYYYSRRNGYRTPPTHRLDLSATWRHEGRRFTSEWSFGIYNTYCRYNPYLIYFEDDPSKPSGTRCVQTSLFGLMPFVSYTIKL